MSNIKKVLIIEEDVCCVCFTEVEDAICCIKCAEGRYCQSCYTKSFSNGIMKCGICRTKLPLQEEKLLDDNEYLSVRDNCMMNLIIKRDCKYGKNGNDVWFPKITETLYQMFDDKIEDINDSSRSIFYQCGGTTDIVNGKKKWYVKKGTDERKIMILKIKLLGSKKELDFNVNLFKSNTDGLCMTTLTETKNKKYCNLKIEC